MINTPSTVTPDDYGAVRTIVVAAVRGLRVRLGRWPSQCEVMCYLVDVMAVPETDAVLNEAAAWVHVATTGPDARLAVLDLWPSTFAVVDPAGVGDEAEAWLHG